MREVNIVRKTPAQYVAIVVGAAMLGALLGLILNGVIVAST